MKPSIPAPLQHQAIAKKYLAKKWSEVKSKKLSVSSIMEEDRKENVAQLLENLANLPGSAFLMQEQNGSSGIDGSSLGNASINQGMFTAATLDPDAHKFRPIEMALVRRAQADLFAYNLAGVQAMNGPVGLAYALRFFYDGTRTEAGFQAIGQYSGWSGKPGVAGSNGVFKVTNAGVVADLKAAGLNGVDAKTLINMTTGEWAVTWTGASTTVYTAGTAVAGWVGGGWGQALSVTDAEKLAIMAPSAGTAPRDIGTAIPNATTGVSPYAMRQLKMSFDKKSIDAQDRMLGASFSVQSLYDIRTMQGVDIGREMVKKLTYESGAEIDREILWKCKNAAVFGDGGQNGVVETFDPTTVSSTFLYDKKAAIADKLISLSNEIHTATLQGSGNILVASPRVCTALQTIQNGSFKSSGVFNFDQKGLIEVGTLDGRIKVYRDPWAYFDGGVDYALVAYKGAGIDEAGVLYHPYMLNLVNTAVAQEDFGTRIGVLSRYAITDSLLGSGRYYRYIEFTGLAALGL